MMAGKKCRPCDPGSKTFSPARKRKRVPFSAPTSSRNSINWLRNERPSGHNPRMADQFEFFDHTADIGAHIYGRALSELFENAARAMYAALGKLQKFDARTQKPLELEGVSLDDLLHDWLAELLH